MPTYVIGDIQGCYRTLRRLMERIGLRREEDRLWFVGDLVNRGTGSLEALRWVREMGDRAVTVLGNHDLHLLGVADGPRKKSPRDTLDGILAAPDRHELLGWLRNRPLLHREGAHVLVHAGILPSWSIEKAERLAHEAEEALRGAIYPKILKALSKRPPNRWQEGLKGIPRIMAILAAFSRLRSCSPNGAMQLGFTGPPDQAPPGHIPWFRLRPRQSAQTTIYFGHWSALGLHQQDGVRALDTGCVWGGTLTALRLEDGKLFQEPCAPQDRPGK